LMVRNRETELNQGPHRIWLVYLSNFLRCFMDIY
jgi:hypothetical protein